MNEKISELPSQIIGDLTILNEKGLGIVETMAEFTGLAADSPLYNPMVYYFKNGAGGAISKKFEPTMSFAEMVSLALDTPDLCREEGEFKEEAISLLEETLPVSKSGRMGYKLTYGENTTDITVGTKTILFVIPMVLNPEKICDKYHVSMEKAYALGKNKDYVYALGYNHLYNLTNGTAEDFKFCTKWDLDIGFHAVKDAVGIDLRLSIPYSRISRQMIGGLQKILSQSMMESISVI